MPFKSKTTIIKTGKLEPDRYAFRAKIAGVFMMTALLLLTGKLWSLQLLQSQSYAEQAYNNRVRLVRLPPSRGKILDSKGRVLAQNIPSFTFSVIPAELEKNRLLIQTYSEILGLPEERIRSLIDRSRSGPKFINFPIKKNLTIEEVSRIESTLADLKGATLETKPLRKYPFKESLCHVIGHLGEISSDELSKSSQLGYRSGDLIGKSGIEIEYESHLKGEEGWEQVEIDAKGHRLDKVSRRAPKAGSDVTLTIDVEFQKYLEDIFYQSAGAIVAIDPDTGRVLAMVSKPAFDLNMFSPSISERNWKELNGDHLHPLENRCIRGLYSPASAFKIITALAVLNEKAFSPDRRFICKGQMEIGGQIFRCWNAHGHGSVNLHRAIVESCDIYFYEAGLKLGPDRIAKYATLFGLGTPTFCGLPQELPGLAPTPKWKARGHSDPWKDGETITMSIGQGYLVSTPIQLAVMTAAVANGGRLMRPAVVQRITSSDGAVTFEHTPVVRSEIQLNPGIMAQVESAMKDVVIDPKGTGKKCRIANLNIYAKTGTSQVIRAKERIKEDDRIPYHERTHAIFIAYVKDQPRKIALAVIVEHGGGGGSSAGPIARKALAKYYGLPDPGDSEEK